MGPDVSDVNPEDRELRLLLGEARTVAVVGLSPIRIAPRTAWPPTCRGTGTGSSR